MTVQLADLTKRTGSPLVSSHRATYRKAINGAQPSNDSGFSSEGSVHNITIAPSDRYI